MKGKLKNDFEKWYSDLVWSDKFDNDWYSDMNFMSPSHQWGILQDFADSVEDETGKRMLGNVTRGFDKYFMEYKAIMQAYPTRKEARKAAIERFQEIYNEK